MEEQKTTTEYEFDFDSIPQAHIKELHQEGNWLHGLTDTGIRFSQHIKQGKRLNKKGDRFVIEDVEVA